MNGIKRDIYKQIALISFLITRKFSKKHVLRDQCKNHRNTCFHFKFFKYDHGKHSAKLTWTFMNPDMSHGNFHNIRSTLKLHLHHGLLTKL